MGRFTRLALLAALSVLALLLAGACAQAEKATEVSVQGTEFAFAAPQTVKAGLVTVNFKNNGKQDHEVVLFRLDQGKTMADVQAVLQGPPGPPPAWITVVGGVGGTVPSGSGSATAVLSPGTYGMLCFQPDPADGLPHVAKGMVGSFAVTGDAGKATLPAAAVTVKMKDYAFELPKLSKGPLTVRVMNDGPEDHAFGIVKLAPGKTDKDVLAFFSEPPMGPPPFTSAGGTALSKGVETNLQLNLEAGNYVAFCPIPDAKGTPHFALGMVAPFTVQ